jgi:hypothetical protein
MKVVGVEKLQEVSKLVCFLCCLRCKQYWNLDEVHMLFFALLVLLFLLVMEVVGV